MNELSRFIWGIRICTTVIIAIIGIVVLVVWGMLLTDDMSTYKAGHPNKQVIKALEQELGVKLPAEVKIASISTTTIFFDDDETIKIDVVSNYTEEQWRELIAGGTKAEDANGSGRSISYFKKNIFHSPETRNVLRISVICNETRMYRVLFENGVEDSGNAPLIIFFSAIIVVMIAAIPVLPYEKVYYRIKLGYWS
ncbi:MAG: hypothetical protein MJ104_05050 [Lachnospiraceae bacterium]|nr:hypothetical protein [Lachnospiraceae bacterium]